MRIEVAERERVGQPELMRATPSVTFRVTNSDRGAATRD